MSSRKETLQDYEQRALRVVRYLYENPYEMNNLEKLAGISGYSLYHFHRIMRAYLGESLGAFIQRIRLDNAAYMLRTGDKPVQEIAWDCGYEMSSSFIRAFRKRFGVSPDVFRSERKFARLSDCCIKNQTPMNAKELRFKIRDEKPRKVIYVHGIGKYSEVAGPCWEKVCGFAQSRKLFGFSNEFIGVSYDDPNVTEPDRCRYEACVTVSKEVKPEGEVGFKTLAGGKYLVVKYQGPYEEFNRVYDYVYGKYIPENNLELRDEPCFENYLNSPDKVKPEKLLTEIFIPIQ